MTHDMVEWINLQCRLRGYTIDHLALKSNITVKKLINFLTGKGTLTKNDERRLCVALGYDYEQLVNPKTFDCINEPCVVMLLRHIDAMTSEQRSAVCLAVLRGIGNGKNS